ncbi:unnamed protein product [Blepharisma stoltei]|uniref:Uncharacterized protein n=1 Tax=Blepharisma stoltei TaxID=1481888 RepID=A0AAU9J0Q4_9CILI|nr:unnamed protein product [Blepharisma stoltei]
MMFGLLEIIKLWKELETRPFKQKKLAEENTNRANCTLEIMIKESSFKNALKLLLKKMLKHSPFWNCWIECDYGA